jgi:pimeloyl-ACP methyl ester carboxylesterase
VRSFALSWIAGGAESPEGTAEGRLIDAGMQHYKSRLGLPTYPTDAALRSVTVPALVVIAGRSIIHDPPRAAARARLLPRAEVELWPDASHALTGEYPERVAERVASFLAAHPVQSP